MDTATLDTIDQTFTVAEQSELVISNVSGSITIRAGEVGTIAVRAVKRGNRDAMAHTAIAMSGEGNTVRVETRHDSRGVFGLVRASMSAVDYTVTVPADCHVVAKGVSADIEIDGLRAPVIVETVSGRIRVAGALGECSTTSVSGRVELEDIEGELQARTTSGEVKVLTSRLRTFNLQSVSGAITVDTPLTRDAYYFGKTVSGGLRLLVPEGTGAMVQMKSISGHATVDMPAEVLKAGSRNWSGRINGGGATVEFSSVSGSLYIGRGTDGPASPSEDVTERSSQGENARQTKSEILSALERGEISVDDALSRLEGVR